MSTCCKWRFVFGGILVAAVFQLHANAQQNEEPPSAPYRVGQRVTVNWHGNWVPGIVVDANSVARFGRLNVKTKKLPHGWTFDLKDVRPVPSIADSATSNSVTADPFATDDEKAEKIGLRTWTDTTGRFKVEARVARLQQGAVVLRRADGNEVTVPLAKLSSRDQGIIHDLWGARGYELDTNPADDEMFLNTLPGAAPEVKILEIDATAARPLHLDAESTWTYVPQPTTEAVVVPVSISLGARRDVHDELNGVLFSSDMSHAMLMHRNKVHDESPARVTHCDVTKGSVIHQSDFYTGQLPLSVSPDGRTLIARSEGYGKSSTLYVHALDGFKAEPKYGWQPYAMLSGHASQRDVVDALFVDNKRVLTMSNEGVLQLWSIGESVQLMYFGRVSRGGGMSLRIQGDCLPVRSDDGVVLLEPSTGKSLGRLSAPGKDYWPQMAIRSDGKRLVLAEGGRIRVWDLGAQELVRDFNVSNVSTFGPVVWTDDERILVDGNLIDVERRVVLWRYTGLERVIASGGGLTWSVNGGRTVGDPQMLIGAALPHPAAKVVADGLDAEEILAIRPGMEVGIELLFSGSVADHESVRRVLSKRLEEVGLTPVGQSAAMLTASITRGEFETFQCQGPGQVGMSQHTVPSHVMELSLTLNGKKVWAKTLDTRQHGVCQVKEGESVEVAVARSRNVRPRRFELEFVPGCVAKPNDESGAAYGTSKMPGALW